MRKNLLVLSALLLLTACELSIHTQRTLTSSESAATARVEMETYAEMGVPGDLGWYKLKGAVYSGNIAPGRELAGVVVRCDPADHPRPGSCSPYQVTTGDDGSFAFEVFVHDTIPIFLTAEKPGYKSMEYRSDRYQGEFQPLLLVPKLPNTSSMTLVNRLEDQRDDLLAIRDGYAYLSSGLSLSVFDVSDPALPAPVGNILLSGYNTVNDIAVANGYAYLARGNDGLRVVDISNPNSPVELNSGDSSAPGGTYSDQVVIENNFAYVSEAGYERLVIFDLSDPSSPRLAGIYAMPRRMVEESDGKYYDILGGEILAFTGNYLLVAGMDIRILDISNPVDPLQIGVYDLPFTDNGFQTADDMAVAGGFAYVAAGFAGLQIVDLSDPAAPKGIGFFPEIGYAKRVVVEGDFAYVLDGYGRVWVVDISNPAALVTVGLYDALEGGEFRISGSDWGGLDDIGLIDNYIFVVSESGGLYILNFNPSPDGG